MKRFLRRFQKGDLPRNRIEAVSDGIFAIVLTLLILEIKLPAGLSHNDHDLLNGLLQTGPQITSWVSSFLVLSVFWVNHDYILGLAKKMDHAIVWINVFLMLLISFVPFPTAVLGDHPGSPVAMTFFCLVLFLAGTLAIFLRWYVVHYLSDGPKSHKHDIQAFIFGPSLYFLAAVFSWWEIGTSYFLILFIPIYFMIPREQF